MSVTVSNVTKIFGQQKALDNISIQIQEGSVTGLLGPNGAGKSTLMKIICCFTKPSSGTVDVCGYNIETNPFEVKRNIGYLPENNPLYTDMYVKEYLNYIAGIHNIKNKRQRIGEVMESTGLILEAHKTIKQLSKGYRQRVGLAQALLHDPKVLILDEPTTGLDPNQLTEIRTLIKNLGKNKTVILSTHIMQEVEAICNKVVIINKGRIIANDTVGNIITQSKGFAVDIELKKPFPKNPFQNFLYKKHVSVIEDGEISTKFFIKFDTEEDLRDKLFNFAKNSDYTVLSLNLPERKLEDAFIDLVQ